MTAPDQSQHSAVIEYYDATWKDYTAYWLDGRNLAMHFGFSDQTTKTHAQALTRMNEVMADRAGIGPNDRMLDAGCGVGEVVSGSQSIAEPRWWASRSSRPNWRVRGNTRRRAISQIRSVSR